MSIVEPPTTIEGGPPPYSLSPEPRAPAQGGVRWLTVVILWSAAGIALLSVSYALARANVELDAARLLYWAALAAIAGPALVRMLAPSAGRSERILLVALTTLFLYWIKVLHDPVGLFIPDEFYHLANAQRLAETGRLYGENLLLPVSPDYPGLTVITVALSKLSGLGLFPCALLLIGIVKVGLSVALFLLFERLSGSARIGGVAALLYCAHSNYLYFTSQFSYESLSVPLLACVLLCLVARNGLERPQRAAWTAIGCLLTCAVVTTHHLTAYALALILWAQVVLTLVKRRPDVRPPLAMAVVATVASIAWAVTIAGDTGGYLGSIFDRLDGAISEAVRTEAVTRLPFQSGSTGGNFSAAGPPLDDRLFSVSAVLLVTLGVFAGLIVARRRSWRDPFVVLLGLAALAALAAYPLRLHPATWEISNRTSEFLFLGVAFFSAVAAVAFVGRGRGRWRVFAVAAAGVVAIAGGAVVGWPGGGRLPRPVTAKVAGAHIDAPGPLMADWARAHLPRDSVMVANDSDGRLLAVAGFNHVFAGPTHAVPQLLGFDVIPQWQWDFLREQKVRYVVLNRRVESRDNVIGYFYPRPAGDEPPIGNWSNVRRKYEVLPGAVRVYDGGDIVIYDIRRPLRIKEAPFDG